MKKTLNILIVSRSFYPINSPRSFRATELAKEFSVQGHKVTVITPRLAEQVKFAKDYNIHLKDMVGYEDSEFEVQKIPNSFIHKVKERIKQQYLLYPLIKLKDYVHKSLKEETGAGYDLLISIAAPHPVHWGVSNALQEFHGITKCWIADCGDPFMLSHNMQFNYPFYFKYFEKDFCRKADFITIPTESAKEGYYKEFRDKLRVIPQGFKFEEVKLSDKAPQENVLQFGYAGSLIPGRRDPSELLSYLKEKEVDFQFIIYTKNSSFVERLTKKYPGKVVYCGEADRLDLLHHLSELDFVLNFENLGTNQTPSKLIDYGIIKKPILSIKAGNLDRQVVDQFIERNYTSQLQLNDINNYRIENVVEKFLELSN